MAGIPVVRPQGAASGQRTRPAMDVILHIGAHRCATTTFQSYLRLNADRLAARGLGFRGPHRTRGGLFRGIQPGPHIATGRDAQRRGVGRVRLHCARSAAAGLRQVLISDENMMGSIRGNLRMGTLYSGIGERMARFDEAFDGQVTRVALSIRSHDHYWASALGYAVTRGFAVPGPSALRRIAANRRGWQDVVTDLACAMPDADIVVLPFETYAGRPDAQLSAMCGGPAPREHARLWRNATPPLEALRAAASDRARSALPAGAGRWAPFDAAQGAALRELYADDLMWLRAGADGLARLITDETKAETGPNKPGPQMTRGRDHDRQDRRMAQAR